MKSIYIPGIPDTKMRPRATKTGHVYDPNAQAKEASIQKAQLTGDTDIYTGPLQVSLVFVFPRPKKHFRTGKRSNELRPDAPEYCHEVQKDLDNMEKFYCDAFNFIHYHDDRQIVRMDSGKRWAGNDGELPHVRMDIRQI